MSWGDIALESLTAAQSLKPFPRSCISRAYYAAYASVTQALVDSKGVSFPKGREGPNHSDLSDLIGNHLIKTLDRSRIREMKAIVRRLYAARLLADYSEAFQFMPGNAVEALVDASWIIRELKTARKEIE